MLPIYFSVIIPLFNKGETIVKCLTSIIEQNRLPNEIIIVNDGSTDKSVEVALSKKYEIEKKGIKFSLINKKNGGVSSARNRGIIEAKEDSLLCFLDADDTWHPCYLKEIDKATVYYPNYNIYCSGYSIFSSGGIEKKIFTKQKKNIMIINHNDIDKIGEFPFFPSSFCIRKRSFIYEELYFPECQNIGEDLNCFFLLGILNDAVYINKALVYYHIDTPGNTASNNRAMDLPAALPLLKGKKEFHDTILKNKDINYYDYLLLFFLKSSWKSGDTSSLRCWSFSWKRKSLSTYIISLSFYAFSFLGRDFNIWISSCVKKLKILFSKRKH